MKKVLAGLAVVLVAAAALAVEVQSQNGVGVKRVDLVGGGKFNLLSYNWNDIGGVASISIQKVLDVSLLQQGSTPAAGDNLLLWDASQQKYVTAYLSDGFGGAYPAIIGQWVLPGATDPATNMITRGDGFWLVRRGAALTVSLLGEIPVNTTSTHSFVGSGKFTMFGSAYPADVAVNSVDWTGAQQGSTPASADNLLMWDKSIQKYVTLYMSDGFAGAYPAIIGKWVVPGATDPAVNVLAIGDGAWYRRVAASTFSWSESKPYTFGN